MRFIAEWQTVQSRFVDHPKAAVTEADDLIAALLEARGYPKDGFEQRAADVSVSYPQRDVENSSAWRTPSQCGLRRAPKNFAPR